MEKENQNEESKPSKNTLKDYFQLGEVGGYFFRKKNPDRPTNFSIKVMHGINRISLLIFLVAIVIFLVKKFLF